MRLESAFVNEHDSQLCLASKIPKLDMHIKAVIFSFCCHGLPASWILERVKHSTSSPVWLFIVLHHHVFVVGKLWHPTQCWKKMSVSQCLISYVIWCLLVYVTTSSRFSYLIIMLLDICSSLLFALFSNLMALSFILVLWSTWISTLWL